MKLSSVVGSRTVPHRLNEAERKEWDLAKKRKYLQLRGSGWRRERGDSPLANIYRNYCDAVAIPCINIERAIGVNNIIDYVSIDFSPLRRIDVKDAATVCIDQCSEESFKEFVLSIEDNSDYLAQGWDGIEEMLQQDAIWRIPSSAIVVAFNERTAGKKYAERLVALLCKNESDSRKLKHTSSCNDSV